MQIGIRTTDRVKGKKVMFTPDKFAAYAAT